MDSRRPKPKKKKDDPSPDMPRKKEDKSQPPPPDVPPVIAAVPIKKEEKSLPPPPDAPPPLIKKDDPADDPPLLVAAPVPSQEKGIAVRKRKTDVFNPPDVPLPFPKDPDAALLVPKKKEEPSLPPPPDVSPLVPPKKVDEPLVTPSEDKIASPEVQPPADDPPLLVAAPVPYQEKGTAIRKRKTDRKPQLRKKESNNNSGERPPIVRKMPTQKKDNDNSGDGRAVRKMPTQKKDNDNSGDGRVVVRKMPTQKKDNDNSGDGRKQPRTTAPPSDRKNSGGTPKHPNDGNGEFYEMVGKAMAEFPWYHGLMPRAECEELLKADGDFLVRQTTVKKIITYIVTVQHEKTIKHVPLDYNKPQTLWMMYQESGPTLNELMDRLVKEAKPVGSGIVLKTGVHRPDYYLLHENIVRIRKLGSGAFGEVYLGTIKQKDGSTQFTAIKTIKGAVKKTQLSQFIKEAKIMLRLNHPNIVRMYGMAPQEDPLMIVLEFANVGDLRKYLKKSDANEAQLMAFVKDAARGMCYLSRSQIIHRDLAARNCLLGEHNVLKISDFGLSVADTTELKLEHLKKVPIKWLSPESITKGVFTTKTDVWSFGVLTWEIFNKCKTDPFPGETNAQAKLKILGDGQPMELPADAPLLAKAVLSTCFNRDPTKRVDFTMIHSVLSPEEPTPMETLLE